MENKVKDHNYYQISGWMLNQLHLKGTELQVFAIIYGFSQDGETEFTGSIKYLCEFTGASRPTIIKALKSLTAKELLIKTENVINGVQFNRYKISLQVVKKLYGGGKEILPKVVKKLYQGGKETLPNNNNYNNIYNNNYNNIYMQGTKKQDVENIPLEKNKKNKISEFVSMTDDELKTLKSKYPKEGVDKMIEVLDNYKGATGKKYKSDYRAILNWVVDKVKKESPNLLDFEKMERQKMYDEYVTPFD